MVHRTRRTPRHDQLTVHSSIRTRPGSFRLLASVTVVGALSLALHGMTTDAGFRLAPATGSSPRVAAEAAAPPVAGATIPDVPWLVQRPDGGWVYGRGARSIPHRLAAGETGLAISERWVASVIPTADGRSTVRFRDRQTGRRAADLETPMWVSAGAFVDAGLIVTGYGDRSMTIDGGMMILAPEAGTATVLVAGGPFDPRLGRPVARGDVAVSPSGHLAASNACGVRLCDTQVVDLVAGTVSRPVRAGEGFLRVLTDDAIVTTDGDARWISARGIVGGEQAWRGQAGVLLDPIAVADGSVVGVTGTARDGGRVVSIDRRGAIRDLGPRSTGGRSWPRIWTAMSGPSAVVVAGQPFAEWLGSGDSLAVTVFSLSGGRSTSAAASLRLPSASEWTR